MCAAPIASLPSIPISGALLQEKDRLPYMIGSPSYAEIPVLSAGDDVWKIPTAALPDQQVAPALTSATTRGAFPPAALPSLIGQTPTRFLASCSKLELDLEPNPFEQSFGARIIAGSTPAPAGILSGMTPTGLTPFLNLPTMMRTPSATESLRPTLPPFSAVSANSTFPQAPAITSVDDSTSLSLAPSNPDSLAVSQEQQQPTAPVTAAAPIDALPTPGAVIADSNLLFRQPRFPSLDGIAEDQAIVFPDATSESLPMHLISRPLYDVSTSQSVHFSPSILFDAASRLEEFNRGIAPTEVLQRLPQTMESTDLPLPVLKVDVVSPQGALQPSSELAVSVSPEATVSTPLTKDRGSPISSSPPGLSVGTVSPRKRKKTEITSVESPLTPDGPTRPKRSGGKSAGTANCSRRRRTDRDTPVSASFSPTPSNSKAKSAKGRRRGVQEEKAQSNEDDSHEEQYPPPAKGKGRGSIARSANASADTAPGSEEEKRKSFLERNRQAALKCRQRKKQWLQTLHETVEALTGENEQLQEQATTLRETILNIKALLLANKDCPAAKANGAADADVINGTEALPRLPAPASVVPVIPSPSSAALPIGIAEDSMRATAGNMKGLAARAKGREPARASFPGQMALPRLPPTPHATTGRRQSSVAGLQEA